MLVNIFLRTIFIYIVVLFLIRIMGKREVGQLSAFDLVVAIMIAELAVFPLENLNIPIYLGLVPILTLVGAEILFSYLCLKSRKIREIINGNPSTLIVGGKILEKEMRKLRYNINDLLGQLREKDITNVADVEYAILETSGQLSVALRPEKRPLTPSDINIKAPASGFPSSVILDGEIINESLSMLNLDEEQFRLRLDEKGLKPEDVFYASMDINGELYVSKKDKPRERGGK